MFFQIFTLAIIQLINLWKILFTLKKIKDIHEFPINKILGLPKYFY